jgi:hypothetical protein
MARDWALLAEDAALIGKPFAATGSARAIQANTRHLVRLLQDARDADRAQRAAAFACALQDTLIAADAVTRQATIACAKGCAHCCTTAVSATIPEVLALAAALRADAAHGHRVRTGTEQTAAKVAATGRDWWSAAHLPCPVLADNMCSAYAARPSACRGLLSTSLATCVEIFASDGNTPMAYPGDSAALRTVVLIMMKAALKVSGLTAAHMVLTPALAIALATPDAEARWLAGEPLFDAVPQDRSEQNQYLRGLVDGLAAAIRPAP